MTITRTGNVNIDWTLNYIKDLFIHLSIYFRDDDTVVILGKIQSPPTISFSLL